MSETEYATTSRKRGGNKPGFCPSFCSLLPLFSLLLTPQRTSGLAAELLDDDDGEHNFNEVILLMELTYSHTQIRRGGLGLECEWGSRIGMSHIQTRAASFFHLPNTGN